MMGRKKRIYTISSAILLFAMKFLTRLFQQADNTHACFKMEPGFQYQSKHEINYNSV